MATAYITRFEACEVVAMRAVLLSQGATTRLRDNERQGVKDPVWIAREELLRGRIDAIVRRPVVGGETLEYNVRDMILPTNII